MDRVHRGGLWTGSTGVVYGPGVFCIRPPFPVTPSPPRWWTKTKDLSLAPFVRPPAIMLSVSLHIVCVFYLCLCRFVKGCRYKKTRVATYSVIMN